MPTRAKSKPKFKRVLLKLSGEALGGEAGSGISPEVVLDMAQQIAEIHALGVQLVIVVGGGNIFRGLSGSERGIERGGKAGAVGERTMRLEPGAQRRYALDRGPAVVGDRGDPMGILDHGDDAADTLGRRLVDADQALFLGDLPAGNGESAAFFGRLRGQCAGRNEAQHDRKNMPHRHSPYFAS